MKTFADVKKRVDRAAAEDQDRVVSPIPDIPIDSDARLSDDQAEALTILQSGKNSFLAGSAGTGKSFLLRRFIDLSRSANKSVLVTAPTGIAAHHLQGATLHSAFCIPCDCNTDNEDGILKPWECMVDDANWSKMLQQWQYEDIHNCDILVIDEISMVRADVFKWVWNVLCVEKANNPEHNIQLVCCGDFYQIPPVIEDEEEWRKFYPDTPEGYVFLSREWQDSHIRMVELKEIVRQSQQEYAKALEQIRLGDPSGEGRKWVQLHAAKEPIANVCTLCGTRDEVDDINNAELDKLDGKPAKFEAIIGDSDHINWKKIPTMRVLDLKLGAPVMTVINDYMGRYYNGSRGIVVDIDEDRKLVRIKMDSSGQVVDIIPHNFSNTCLQLPLVLAWACTFHKAQGATFKALNISAKRVWQAGQLYVALSRCTDIRNMYIDGDLLSLRLTPNQSVVRFYDNQHAMCEFRAWGTKFGVSQESPLKDVVVEYIHYLTNNGQSEAKLDAFLDAIKQLAHDKRSQSPTDDSSVQQAVAYFHQKHKCS